MTDQEKAAKYDEIAEALWNMAEHGTELQSTWALAFIRHQKISAPEESTKGTDQ